MRFDCSEPWTRFQPLVRKVGRDPPHRRLLAATCIASAFVSLGGVPVAPLRSIFGPTSQNTPHRENATLVQRRLVEGVRGALREQRRSMALLQPKRRKVSLCKSAGRAGLYPGGRVLHQGRRPQGLEGEAEAVPPHFKGTTEPAGVHPGNSPHVDRRQSTVHGGAVTRGARGVWYKLAKRGEVEAKRGEARSLRPYLRPTRIASH